MQKSFTKFNCLSLVLFLALFSSVSFGQYLEEAGTLESIYENRARAALNTVLKPQEYSLVISAEINRDETKLKEYNQEQELLNLPGMPMPGAQADMPGHNILHDLKSKIEVNLILNLNIPPDKEEIIKGLIVSKLHLDETAGDKVNISRANLVEDEEKAPLLPEYSWKTWLMFTIAALLGLAGIIFWSSRKQNKEVKVSNELPQFLPSKLPEDPAKKENTESDKSAKAAASNEHDEEFLKNLQLEVQLQKMKEHIIQIGTNFPHAASQGINDYLNQKDKMDVINTFEVVGWDVARTIFSPLSVAAWGSLGNLIKTKPENLTVSQKFQSISQVYNFILSSYLQVDGNKDVQLNPFHFLSKLSREELKFVLLSEHPKNLAVISLYLEPAQFELFFADLSSDKHDQVAVEIANIKQLPMRGLEILAQGLQSKLSQFRQNPIVSPDGPDVMARILRVLTAEEEMKIVQNLIRTNPADSIKIRSQVLYFPDAIYLPPEVVSDFINSRDLTEISTALTGFDGSSREAILSSLPKKKAEMIRVDIDSATNAVSPKTLAETWRRLSMALEAEMKSKGLILRHYVENQETKKLRMAS
ncbi:MAG: hypothetical protein B7Y39_11005 [Bdellovibrio sp. 28-41-41]|nr:MAG: hypothetical protein B7Y39_11005 [Bdellovibrio sp. 28-41-41]